MTKKEYENYVEARCKGYVDANYCVVAINEEAGEIAGWWKKFKLRDNPTGKLTYDDLKGELGDVLFYVTALTKNMGWTLDDIIEHNVAKLDDREAKKMRSVC